MFQPVPEVAMSQTTDSTGEERPPHIPPKLTEGKLWEKASWVMELNISEDAEPGDYELVLIFTYETGIFSSNKKAFIST